MIKPIMKNESFLKQPSEPATLDDAGVAQDLLDTIMAHAEECVGMAANMIGVRKNIIVVNDNGMYITMLNPQILSHAGSFRTQEGCLSLEGTRHCIRYRTIKVAWSDLDDKQHMHTYTGRTAVIIQHECDHLHGVLI